MKVSTFFVLLMATLVASCGIFVGNPKQPMDGSGGSSADQPKLVVESDEVKGARLYFSGPTAAASEAFRILAAAEFADESVVSLLGLSGPLTLLSPAVNVESKLETVELDLDKYIIEIPLSEKGLEGFTPENAIMLYRLATTPPTFGYLSSSIWNQADSLSVRVRLKVGFGTYQFVMVGAPPPLAQDEAVQLAEEAPTPSLSPTATPTPSISPPLPTDTQTALTNPCERAAQQCAAPANQFDQFQAGVGSAADPYIVCSGAHLTRIKNHLTGTFLQGADIDMTDRPLFNPIGAIDGFQGTFDGCGHQIQRMKIDQPYLDHAGMFAWIGNSGRVTNLTLIDSHVEGKDYVGALAGQVCGVVEKVVVRNSTGFVIRGSHFVGGLAGVFGADENRQQTNCTTFTAESAAKVHQAGMASGEVIGIDKVGGLIGWSFSTRISEVYSLADVTTRDAGGGLFGTLTRLDTYPYIRDCYFRGRVSGTHGVDNVQSIGGLVGEIMNAGGFQNCYVAKADLQSGGATDIDIGTVAGFVSSASFLHLALESSDDFLPIGRQWGLKEYNDQIYIAPLCESSSYENINWDFKSTWVDEPGIAEQGCPKLRWQP